MVVNYVKLRRILALTLAFVLVFASIPIQGLAEPGMTVTFTDGGMDIIPLASGGTIIDLSDPNPPASGDGWTYSMNVYTIYDGADVTVVGSNAGSQRRIQVAANAAAVITLNNASVNMGAAGYTGDALQTSPLLLNNNTNVTLNLLGTNTLIEGAGRSTAGIRLLANVTLTINGPGSLTAIGSGYGAGIGGGNTNDYPSGYVIINGCTVEAVAGGSADSLAEAIGRGNSGGNVTVTYNGIYDYWTNTTAASPAEQTGAGVFTHDDSYKYIKLEAMPIVRNMGELENEIAKYPSADFDRIIFAGADFPITSPLTIPPNANGKTLSILSFGASRTLTRGAQGNLITINPGAKLILEKITIDGAKSGIPNAQGAVVYVQGIFEMEDGAVIQNNGSTGGGYQSSGVHVGNGGVFYMYGGEIKDNALSGDNGAGVYVTQNGTFNMTDGTISGNSTSANGGGVFLSYECTFNMSGGVISGNVNTSASTVNNAGGLYVFSSADFTVGGTAKIFGNMKNGQINNLYLHYSTSFTPNSAAVTLGNGANGVPAPAPSMEIGVNIQSDHNGIIVESGAADSHKQHFIPDDNSRIVQYENEKIILVATNSNVIYMFIEDPPASGSGWTYSSDVYTILDGADVTVIGSNSGSERRLEVAAGAEATITLDGVTIAGLGYTQSPLLLNSGAEVTLMLADGSINTFTAGPRCAGIQAPLGTSLTIHGTTGSLTATGNTISAGIGGAWGVGMNTGGNITVSGGIVTASGGNDGGSGIGGSVGGSSGTILINGTAQVTASGGGSGTVSGGSGIGGGGSGGSGGHITVEGNAIVTASGGSGGAGIGGGGSGAVGIINVSGGTVTAVGSGYAAGIGGGASNTNWGNITISGGNITAIAGSGPYAAAIGSGSNAAGSGSSEVVTVTGRYEYWTNTVNSPVGAVSGGIGTFAYSDSYKYIRLEEVPISSGRTISMKDPTPPPSGTGWTYSNDVYTILDGADVLVTSTNNGSQRRITVAANAAAAITLDGVTITNLARDQCPLLLDSGANVTLNIENSSALTARDRGAGIGVPSGASLTIDSAGGRGALTANGGDNSAGIGGIYEVAGGAITINGGTVIANGGVSGAGIGGGLTSGGGAVAIHGGTVTANGGNNAAGIGSGRQGINAGTITITGGTVTAVGMNSSAGIGGGFASNGGNIIISGGTVTAIAAGNSDNAAAIGRGGYGSEGTVSILGIYEYYTSTSAAPPGSATGPGKFVYSNTYKYIQLVEKSVSVGDTINVSDNNPPASGDGWTYASNVYTILDDADIIVIGTSANQRRLEVLTGAEAKITLDGVTITGLGSYQSPLLLNSGAELNLFLENDNTLKAGDHCAGILVPPNAVLTIDGPGALTASSSILSAGIGGGNGSSPVECNAGKIIINGGTVIANGSNSSAGIGGGFMGNGGEVIITGGTVKASGGFHGAGIGGGEGIGVMGGGGGIVIVTGGTVTAITEGSSGNAAAIGVGRNGTGGTVSITGTYDYWTNTANTDPGAKTGTNTFSGTVTQINSVDINTLKYIKLAETAAPTPITSAAISVHAPAKGVPPNTTASGTGDFSIGTVSWTPNDSVFLGSTIYTATVTLTANTGYTFTGLTAATINGQAATVSNNTGTAVTLTYTFPATADKEVTGIAIKNQPVNLTYTHGDQFNLSGLTVTLTYGDMTTEDVAFDDFAAKNITANPSGGYTLSHTLHNGEPVVVECGNYTANTSGLTVNKAAGNFGAPSAVNTVYATGLTLNDVTLPAGYTWNAPATALNAGNGQTFAATYTDPSGNYAAAIGTITVNVEKASTGFSATAPHNLMISSANTNPHTFGLTAIALNKSDHGTLGFALGTFTDSTNILTAPPNISGGSTLTYTGVGKITGTATQIVTISSQNYTDITVTITFEATPKTEVTIGGLAAQDSVYDGTAKIGVTGTATSGAFDASGLVYTYAGTGIVGTTAAPPTNAGNYTLTVSVPDSGPAFTGSEEYTFTISPRDINSARVSVNITGSRVYTGSQLTPAYTVTDSVTITIGDYTSTYGTNIDAGTGAGSIALSGQENYTGTKTVTFNIDKANGAAVNGAPAVNGTPTEVSITVTAVTNAGTTGQSVEYAISTTNGVAPSSGWQSGTTFTGLNSGTIYYVYARTAESANYNAGAAQASAGITTLTAALSSACDIVSVSAPSGAVISGTNITANVSNGTSSQTITVTVSAGASWGLYSDSACANEITNKTISYSVGTNTVYIKVVAADGTTHKFYTITVTRAGSGDHNGNNGNTGGNNGSNPTAPPSPLPEQGNSAASIVTLDFSGVEDARVVIFNVETAQLFSDAKVSVTLILPNESITLDPETLATLATAHEDGETLITVEAVIIPMSGLSGMQAAQAKGYETVISIDVFVGDEKIDVPLTVSLPYSLKPNENSAAVRVWHMDGNGDLTDLNGVYDPAIGMITFTVEHQSYFVVGYEPVTLWVNIFNDIAVDNWYYDAVAYANYYGLFGGYGGGVFAPQDNMTRAMFVTVLYKLEGNPALNGSAWFTDIEPGAWYHDAVQWAAENGIVSGVGGGRYAPDKAIARQEMAVMLMNYADYKGYDVPENRPLLPLTDYDKIDMWAETPSLKLIEAGVLSGDNNEFRPKDTASRAEVAQMFKNFLRFVLGR